MATRFEAPLPQTAGDKDAAQAAAMATDGAGLDPSLERCCWSITNLADGKPGVHLAAMT